MGILPKRPGRTGWEKCHLGRECASRRHVRETRTRRRYRPIGGDVSYRTFNSGTWRGARGRVFALCISLATIIAGLAVINIASASAADRALSFSLDRGIINLGSTTGVKIVDPDLSPPDNPATLAATLADDGAVSAPKTAFTFPKKTITGLETGNSLLPVVDAKIEISAADAITGTWDADTGAGTISVPTQADITVYPSGSPASVAKCRVSGFNLDLATTGVLVDPATDPDTEYPAAAFAPPSGNGAAVDNWDSLPDSTVLGGSLGSIVCPAVNGLIGGPGGIWLSGTATIGGEVVPTPPVKEPKITTDVPAETNLTNASFQYEAGEGETQQVTKFQCRLDSTDESAWESCDSGSKDYTGLAAGAHKFEVRAGNDLGYGPAASHSWTITGGECPDGTTGTPPNCITNPGKPKLAALKIAPKNKGVKRGKKATITVKVKNTGNAAAKGAKVCVTAPKKLVQVKKCVKFGQIGAGATKTAKFKVKVKKKAKKGKKAVLKFKATTSNAGSKSGKAKIKIK